MDGAAAMLRPARAADADFLFALFVHAHGSVFAHLDDATRDALLQMQFRAQDHGYRTRFPNARFDVIECGGAPIGRLVVDRSEREIRVVDVALLPAHRNRGIGTSLLRALLAEAAANGRAVTLHVARDNPARSLYQRLGFASVSEDAIYVAMTWHQPNTAS